MDALRVASNITATIYLIVSVAGLDGLAFAYEDVHRFDLFFSRDLVFSGGELDGLVLGN
jgi:hypothetical protein